MEALILSLLFIYLILREIEKQRSAHEEGRREAILAAPARRGLSMRQIAAELDLTSGLIAQIIDRSR